MRFQDHEWIAATPRQTWNTLLAPAQLQRCLHDCQQIERISDNEYRIHFGTSEGTILIEEATPPHTLKVVFEGSGRHAGLAIGHAHLQIEPGQHGGTRVGYHLEAAAGGALAKLGEAELEKRARHHLEGFFLRLNDLAAEAPGAEPPPPAPPQQGRSWGAWLIGAAVLLVIVAYFTVLRP